MSKKPANFYEFAGLRLFPESQQLEILSGGKTISLSQNHCRFLFVLAQKPREIVSYEEFRQKIWTHLRDVDDTLKKNIHSTKNGLKTVLKTAGINPDFIESVTGKGYRLDADVFKNVEETAYFPTAAAFSVKPQIEKKIYEPKRHSAFVFAVSFFYGLLFWSALLLESAYKFHDLSSKVFWFAPPLILCNGAVMFAALYLTNESLRKKRDYALFTGVLMLVVGALVSSLMILYVLPNEPVTLARFQTQPAIGAYIKNVWMYFLPLGIFFVLLPFYAVCGREFEKKVFTISPKGLFGLWLAVLIYSIFSTFYLLDNLLPSENHSLFTIAVVFRFINYFGLAIAVLLWYFSYVETETESSFRDFPMRLS